MPVTAINHYLVVSKNLERSKKFYQEVLGLELAERPDFGFPGYWLKTGDNICVHLASQNPNKIRDQFLLKKHPKGTNGSGSVDHIAFLAQEAQLLALAGSEVRRRVESRPVLGERGDDLEAERLRELAQLGERGVELDVADAR